MKSPTPSAGLIAWGLILWFAGSMAALWGMLTPDEGIFGSVKTSGWVYAGGIGSLVGLVLVTWGVFRLASAVDLLFGDLMDRRINPPRRSDS